MAAKGSWSHAASEWAPLLMGGDLGLLAGGLLLVRAVEPAAGGTSWLSLSLSPLLSLLSLHVAGLYQELPGRGARRFLPRLAGAAALAGILSGALALALPALRVDLRTSLAGVGLGMLGAAGLRSLLSLELAAVHLRERVLVLGATPVADRLLSQLETEGLGVEVLGYVDDRPPETVRLTNGFRILGNTRELPELVAANQAGTIVVALEDRRGAFPLECILRCKLQGVRIEDWPTFYEKLTGKILLRNLRPSWLIFSEGFRRSRLTRVIKRAVDVTLAAVFLLLGLPVFLLVAVAIHLDSPGPIFFRQERVGEGGRVFTLRKFRTMVQDAERQTGPVWACEEDPRITRLGRWLRKSRLDELPQILNVLKGEMSFVGPRPERPHFVARLQEQIPFYAHRHTVKPGITGWAQVRYRYGATVEDAEEKLQYDLFYVKNLSGLFDLYILLCTVRVVLFGSGAR